MRARFLLAITVLAAIAAIVFAAPAALAQNNNPNPVIVCPAIAPGQHIICPGAAVPQPSPVVAPAPAPAPSPVLMIPQAPSWLWPILILAALVLLGLQLLRRRQPTSSVITDSITVRHPLRVVADPLDLHATLSVTGATPVPVASIIAPGASAPAGAAAAPRNCGGCGTLGAAGARFCTACGRAFPLILFAFALILLFGIGKQVAMAQTYHKVDCQDPAGNKLFCIQQDMTPSAPAAPAQPAALAPKTKAAAKPAPKGTTASTTPATREEILAAIQATGNKPCDCTTPTPVTAGVSEARARQIALEEALKTSMLSQQMASGAMEVSRAALATAQQAAASSNSLRDLIAREGTRGEKKGL